MAPADESDWVFRDRYPERVEVYARMDAQSEAARSLPAVETGIRYGDHPREAFDFFPGPSGAPLVIFIHGGYWQSLSRERFSFVAPPLLQAGFSVALPSYPLAPEARLPTIAGAVDRAVDAIIERLSRSGAPCRSWIASGHSAGGHLALLAALKSRGVPLAGVVAISPICDLEALQETSLDEALSLSRTEVESLSPLRLPFPTAPVRLLVGASETAGFRDQAARYEMQMNAAGGDCRRKLLPELNHYTIPLEIERSMSLIMSAFNELTGRPERQEG